MINLNFIVSRVQISFLLIFVSTAFALSAQELRSYDGTGNNVDNPEWGATHTSLLRLTNVDYEDGISSPAGQNRMNPREISNILFDQPDRLDDKLALSDFVWVFGQFIDHDLSFVEDFSISTNPNENASIIPPINDPFFAPGSYIPMMRSLEAAGTGTSSDNPRQHENAITAFLDASNVYGSDKERADWLRTFQKGKLKTSSGNNLPWNTISGEFNSPVDPSVPAMENGGSSSKFYIAGDVRGNETPLLLSMHTLFVREHNQICDEVILENPNLGDEEIYQTARKIISGKIQAIVYNEWLPSMNIEIPNYSGYSPQINPGISNVFSSAAFRLGHTLINSNIIRLKNNGDVIAKGNISLKDAFFNPLAVDLAGGIEPYLQGMGTQIQQDFDCKIVGDVRNFLFGEPGDVGLDLAAININRARERGIPDYNQVRQDFGLPFVQEFTDLCDDEVVSSLLLEIYGSIDNVDPWVGMLAEIHQDDALFGELVMTILEKQFRALRDGDRFYYENDQSISPKWKSIISNTTLHQVIMRNTSIDLMQTNVFSAMPHEEIPNGPDIQSIDLVTAIYPNPVIDQFYLKTYSIGDKEAVLNVYSQDGILILSQDLNLKEGDNSFNIDINPDLESGLYNCQLISEDKFSVTRFFKS